MRKGVVLARVPSPSFSLWRIDTGAAIQLRHIYVSGLPDWILCLGCIPVVVPICAGRMHYYTERRFSQVYRLLGANMRSDLCRCI